MCFPSPVEGFPECAVSVAGVVLPEQRQSSLCLLNRIGKPD